MQEPHSKKIEDYLRIAIKRKWSILVSFVFFLIGGLVISHTIPKRYSANTLVLVKSPRVSANIIQPMITTGIEERLKTIQEEVMSRSRLYEIIERFNLFAATRDECSIDQLINKMRKNIRVQIIHQDAFGIYYEGSDPNTVAQVANALTEQIISANLRWRDHAARETLNFLEDMLNVQGRKQRKREIALAEFLHQHMAELPEHTERNLRLIEQLNKQMETKQEALKNAKNFKIIYEQRIGDLRQKESASLRKKAIKLVVQKLEELEREFSLLRLRYTEIHPIVTLKQDEINALIKEVNRLVNHGASKKVTFSERTQNSFGSEKGSSIASTSGKQYQENLSPVFGEMSIEMEIHDLHDKIKEVTQTILGIEKDLDDLQAGIDLCHSRIENAPKLEVQLKDLTRQYEQERRHYEELLGKKLDAELALNLEVSRKGEQFIVLDKAVRPMSSFSPDVKKILILSSLFGMGIGLGLAFTRDYFDHTFKDFQDVERTTSVSVLARIPKFSFSIPAKGTEITKYHGNFLKKPQKPEFTWDKNKLRILRGNAATVQEFYRPLYFKLIKEGEQRKSPFTILITSTISGEGKSTTAVELASLWAEESGKRVALVHCNLHFRTSAKSLQDENAPGVSDFLAGTANLDQILQETWKEPVAKIPSGTRFAASEGFLKFQGISRLLDELKKDFDFIILDAPPFMGTPLKVHPLASLSDQVLFVIKAEHTPRELVVYALNLLERNRLSGIVFTHISGVNQNPVDRYLKRIHA